MGLGKAILRLRKARDWTQGQLSTYSGVDQSYLSRIERDQHENVSVKIIAAIAMALDVSVDSILIEGGILPQPEGDKPWSREVLIMQRLLNLYEPGSSERTHLEAIIVAQAEAYLALSGKEEESDEIV